MIGPEPALVHRLATLVGAVLSAAFGGYCLCACAQLAASREAKERAAETTYLAEQLRCVDLEPSLPLSAGPEERHAANARIDVCREGVRRRWGVTTTERDAGGAR